MTAAAVGISVALGFGWKGLVLLGLFFLHQVYGQSLRMILRVKLSKKMQKVLGEIGNKYLQTVALLLFLVCFSFIMNTQSGFWRFQYQSQVQIRTRGLLKLEL